MVQNTSELTNLAWRLEGHRLAQALSLEKVSLINDFAAVGYGVLGSAPEDLYTLQQGQPEPQGTIGIIGAGTGLGQGFLDLPSRGLSESMPRKAAMLTLLLAQSWSFSF